MSTRARALHSQEGQAPGGRPALRVLAITDEVDGRLYGGALADRVGSTDLLLSCGDLPGAYLDFVASTLRAPMLAVHGNHDSTDGEGFVSLHGRVVEEQGLLVAGFDGSVRYNHGAYQFGQVQMWLEVWRIVPRLLWERLAHRRRLDVLITHAPPRGVHDRADPAHQGFDAFRWLIDTFQPRYHLHGHVHLYNRNDARETHVGGTTVLNVFPYRWLEIPCP